ncbi:MAG: 1-deoxy-D-xylulose-5-phosphate synthase [Lachnospiraceae bacterium]|nr:1-deoxy-D-xylulose-5-phosphate synthase [Lachnospiraceae bacterium]
MILERINKPNDIKVLKPEEYEILAAEIRTFLIDKISRSGGHLASNLGVVELTIAMHLVCSLPEDKIIWDVGHQSYTHKLLTGRREGFDELRKYGGISGFPKKRESSCDAFGTGHSSTSISAGLGYAEANRILGKKNTVISVIGDGALTGGMAYEALNNAARSKQNFIIVLNDNEMSISHNVGGMSEYLNQLRTGEIYNGLKNSVMDTLKKVPGGEKAITKIRRTKSGIKQLFIPGMLFEEMGVTYLGPVDGHNIKKLVRVLEEAKKLDHAVLVHVITKKGKGYPPAEKEPWKFHGVEPFDIETGMAIRQKVKPTYTDIFSAAMVKLGEKYSNLVAITAAMPDGTGLAKYREAYPERFFDVGIAEEHAVTFAAGLAAGGMKPVVAVYSSFLQRAYDQMIHDVCIQNLPVIFAVDRAGLVGSDGETHQGIFDLSFLSTIPNMNIFAPMNLYELTDILKFAMEFNGPLAIRYPRGEAYDGLKELRTPIEYGKSQVLYQERDIALIAVGNMVKTAVKVREQLKRYGCHVTLINARFVQPMDEQMLEELEQNHFLVVTLEENILNGGFGVKVTRFAKNRNMGYSVMNLSLPNLYVEHGNVGILMKEVGIDTDTILDRILEYLKDMSK